jgi:hypothetical protein
VSGNGAAHGRASVLLRVSSVFLASVRGFVAGDTSRMYDGDGDGDPLGESGD